MTTPSQFTEQQSVNLMLDSIGERPVNNISTNQRLDVIRAVGVLNEVSLLVQSRGWWFNTEKNFPIIANAAGEYDINPNWIKVDPSDVTVTKFVKRGSRLYNRETFSFIDNTPGAELKIDYTVMLDFDDLPSSVRMYIARRAGVIFQTRSIGSPVLFEFTDRDAQEAWGVVLNEELENEDSNITFAPGIVDAVWNR